EFPPQDRRCPIGIGCCCQQRALREQSTTLIVVRQRYAPETAAVNSGNLIMPREPFVDKRIVRVQKIGHAPILADGAGDEQFSFALKSLQQTLVVIRITLRIDDGLLDTPQIQPLPRKGRYERINSARIREHPSRFSFESLRVAELSAF